MGNKTIRFVVVSLVVFATSCVDCHEQKTFSELSPDRAWIAERSVRDCGATTAEVNGISVHLYGQLGTREDVVASFRSYYRPRLEWLSPNELRIHCNCYEHEIYLRRTEYKSIKVSYDQIRRL